MDTLMDNVCVLMCMSTSIEVTSHEVRRIIKTWSSLEKKYNEQVNYAAVTTSTSWSRYENYEKKIC